MLIRYFAALLLIAGVGAQANSGDIRLKSLEYQEVSLNKVVSDGKYTLVMIWATDCVPCEAQKPMIEQFHAEYHSTKATVIGIANDGMGLIEEISSLIEKNNPSYPNYVASPKTFSSDFEIATGKKFRATPTYIMYNPEGSVMGVAVGPITRDKLDNIISR